MLWKLLVASLLSIGFINVAFIRGRNYIVLLLAVEIIFLAISIAFYSFYMSNYSFLPNFDMLFAAFAILIVAASESAVALALVARIHRKSKRIITYRF